MHDCSRATTADSSNVFRLYSSPALQDCQIALGAWSSTIAIIVLPCCSYTVGLEVHVSTINRGRARGPYAIERYIVWYPHFPVVLYN